jgi:hypothetical protein
VDDIDDGDPFVCGDVDDDGCDPAMVATCEAIPLSDMSEAATIRSKWMNEQIARGRTRFFSDVVDILCAW